MSTPSFPLEKLYDELLIVVFEQLHYDSPESLVSCAAVCRRFYKIASPITFRDGLVISNRPNHKLTNRVIRQGSHLALAMREVTMIREKDHGNDWVLFRALEAAKNLRHIQFVCTYDLPLDILARVEMLLPSVEMELDIRLEHYDHNMWGNWNDQMTPIPEFGSKIVRRLSVDLPLNRHENEKAMAMEGLTRIIMKCKNIREMYFNSPDGEDIGTTPDTQFELDLIPTDIPPQLEILQYPPFTQESMLDWTSRAGWNLLRVLKVNSIDCLTVLSGKVPCLKELTICFYAPEYPQLEDAPAFVAPLEQITLVSYRDEGLPLNFLSNYKDTLKQLIAHSTKTLSPISIDSTIRLARCCPNVERLMIRACLREGWPYNFVRALHTFPKLTTLVLDVCAHPELPESIIDEEFMCNFILQNDPSMSSLSLVALSTVDFNEYKHSFQSLVYGAHRTFFRDAMGNYDVSTRPYPQNRIEAAINRETDHKMILLRPLSCYWRTQLTRGDCIWVARNIYPPMEWAREELIPAGLLTEYDLSSTYVFLTARESFLDDSSLFYEHSETVKTLLKVELHFWKVKKDSIAKYGMHGSLYDYNCLHPGASGSIEHEIEDLELNNAPLEDDSTNMERERDHFPSMHESTSSQNHMNDTTYDTTNDDYDLAPLFYYDSGVESGDDASDDNDEPIDNNDTTEIDEPASESGSDRSDYASAASENDNGEEN